MDELLRKAQEVIKVGFVVFRCVFTALRAVKTQRNLPD
jgi:hypothetical protein